MKLQTISRSEGCVLLAVMEEFEFKDRYYFDDLCKIMKKLRSPEGCPWDREQTHESIKKSLIEETYEVIEAINKKDNTLLCEELGDVLLQVVFHSQMASERESFDIADVCDGICKKLVERHPHVFADGTASTPSEVLEKWDEIKRKSKGQGTQGASMSKVPVELPALMRAEKLQSKARKAGFDWSEISGAYEALNCEIDELKKAKTKQEAEEELGDVLFSAVNVARFLDVEPEEALTKANNKFLNRYLIVERLAEEEGIDMKSTPIEELDKLWIRAKKNFGIQ